MITFLPFSVPPALPHPYSVLAMRVTLDYGTSGLDVEVPDHRTTVIEPTHRPAVVDPHATLAAALRAPVAGPALRDAVREYFAQRDEDANA